MCSEGVRKRRPRVPGNASPPPSTTTSTRRRHSQGCTSGATTTSSVVCSMSSARVARRAGRGAGGRRLARGAASPGAIVRRLRGGGSPARGTAPLGGTSATSRGSLASSSFHARDPGARVRPERRTRGSARPTRGAGFGRPSVWCDARLARRGAAGPDQARARADRGGRPRPTTRGVVAWCEPYRYADAWELAGGPTPFVVCPDQVTDLHNLGAVARSAPRRAQRGRRAGARACPRDARGVPRLRRRGRAPCRSRSCPTWPATSRTSRAPGCGRTPPPPTAAKRSGRPTFPGVSCSSSAQRERACDRSSDAPATRPSAFPCTEGRIPQRRRRRRGGHVRGASSAQRGGVSMAEPTLYLFDGYNLRHAGGSPTRRPSWTPWRARGVAGHLWDRRGRRRRRGSGRRTARRSLRASRGHAARAARGGAPRQRDRLPVSSDVARCFRTRWSGRCRRDRSSQSSSSAPHGPGRQPSARPARPPVRERPERLRRGETLSSHWIRHDRGSKHPEGGHVESNARALAPRRSSLSWQRSSASARRCSRF